MSAGVIVGQGGNATVYRVYQQDLDREVAIKVIRGADEATRRRFDRERRAMGRLSSHPGIVTIYDSGFTDRGEPFLVMPYLVNGSLQDVIEREGRMEWRTASELAIVVAETLQFAHDGNVVHRDVKPGNVMLDFNGAPLVADFGISRMVDASASFQSTALTLTPAYAPPEVIAGERATAASDVYSLAATLFDAVAGSPPFVGEGDNVLALIR